VQRKSITIKIREDIIKGLTPEIVQGHLVKAIKRCPSCKKSQQKNTVARIGASFRINPEVYREYEWVHQPYSRMAKIIESGEGVCLICGSIKKQ
jgi:hypothetical protein